MWSEWRVPVGDYFRTLQREEALFDLMIPIVISMATTWFVRSDNQIFRTLAQLMPTILAILIGFTITCITLLVSSNSDNIKHMKDILSDTKNINGKAISIYQSLLVMFSYSLIVQILVLLWTVIISLIDLPGARIQFFLTFMAVLHVFFLLMRNVTSLYLVFYNPSS